VVTVRAGPRVYLLTPSDATEFKDALIERARSATPRPHLASTAGPSWLDRIARQDLWFRLMGAVAVGVAALDFVLSASRGSGSWSHHTFAAVAALVVNLALGSTMLAGVQAAPRLLLGTTMCGQILAMLW
jgi:hypothetical protein